MKRLFCLLFLLQAYNLTVMYILFLIFPESYSAHALHCILFTPVSQLPAVLFPYLSTSPLRHQYVRDDLPLACNGFVPTLEN